MCTEQYHTYQVSWIMCETHSSAFFLTLTCIIKINLRISHCVTFRDNITSKINTEIHFQFKLDINANFTYQNGEWVLISPFLLLSTHLTPNNLSLIISYYIMLTDYTFHFFNDSKNKTASQPSLIPKGTLSSILTIKLSNDMPAPQFESMKDLQKTTKSATWKYNQEHLISN